MLRRNTLKSFPEAYILDTCQDIYEGLRQWFSMSSEVSGLDMTYFYNQFSVEMVCWRAEGLASGIQGTGAVYQQEFDLSRYPSTEPVSCIYTIESSEELFPDASMAQRMEEWGRSHGLVPEGILYSNNMSSFLGEETNIYYLELYMPVVQSGYHR